MKKLGRPKKFPNDNVASGSKSCGKCLVQKSVVEFNKSKRMWDGFCGWCRVCMAVHQKVKDPVYVESQRREDGLLHCATGKHWKPEDQFYKAKGRVSGFDKECKDCQKARKRKLFEENEAYRQNKYLDRTAYGTARGGRRAQWADKAAIKAMYDEARRRTKETGVKWSVDHEIPLRGKLVSGLHVPANLRLLLLSANTAKGNHFEVG